MSYKGQAGFWTTTKISIFSHRLRASPFIAGLAGTSGRSAPGEDVYCRCTQMLSLIKVLQKPPGGGVVKFTLIQEKASPFFFSFTGDEYLTVIAFPLLSNRFPVIASFYPEEKNYLSAIRFCLFSKRNIKVDWSLTVSSMQLVMYYVFHRPQCYLIIQVCSTVCNKLHTTNLSWY